MGLDNGQATRILTRHLIERGHRRIGHVAGSLHTWSGRERLKGVQATLAESGLNLSDGDLVFGEYSAQKAQTAALALLAGPDRPSALVAANNVTAIGVLRALRQLGLRCPDDVALATVDELPLDDLLTPTVTCAVQPIHNMARRAASWLIERLELGDRPHPPRKAEYPATLRIGGST